MRGICDLTPVLLLLALLALLGGVRCNRSPDDVIDLYLGSTGRTMTNEISIGQACFTADRVQGTCGRISTCPPLLKFIPYIRIHKVYNYLANNMCRKEKKKVYLCCPISGYIKPSLSSPHTLRNPKPSGNPSTTTTLLKSPNGNTASDIENDKHCGLFALSLKIIGGIPVKYGDWPWLVAIGKNVNTVFIIKCGGSLITRYHVLSAAHCFVSKDLATHVRMGDYDLLSTSDGANPADYAIIAITRRGFVQPNFENDVIVLTLDRYVHYTDTIKPACLPKPGFDRNIMTGRNVTAVGWGAIKNDGRSQPFPRQVEMPVRPLKDCLTAYWNRSFSIDERNICSGEQGLDTCDGDSGGPIHFVNPSNNRWTVVGITSFGIGCATEEYPGVSVFVAKYTNWIREVVSRNL